MLSAVWHVDEQYERPRQVEHVGCRLHQQRNDGIAHAEQPHDQYEIEAYLVGFGLLAPVPHHIGVVDKKSQTNRVDHQRCDRRKLPFVEDWNTDADRVDTALVKGGRNYSIILFVEASDAPVRRLHEWGDRHINDERECLELVKNIMLEAVFLQRLRSVLDVSFLLEFSVEVKILLLDEDTFSRHIDLDFLILVIQ